MNKLAMVGTAMCAWAIALVGGQLLTQLRKSPPYLAIALVLLPGGLLLLPLVMVWRSGSTPTSNKDHRVSRMITWPTFWR